MQNSSLDTQKNSSSKLSSFSKQAAIASLTAGSELHNIQASEVIVKQIISKKET